MAVLPDLTQYWTLSSDRLLELLRSERNGLDEREACRRLEDEGPGVLDPHERTSAARIFLRQFESPLLWILFAAAIISLLAGNWPDTWMVGSIVLASGLLGFHQEYRASAATERLLSRLALKVQVMRRGVRTQVPASEVVAGDVVLLQAGSLIPADGVLLEANDLYVEEAALTGESFPVEKLPGTSAPAAGLSEQSNVVFMGSSVRSGIGRMLVVLRGRQAQLGRISERLRLRPPMADFEQGMKRFGGMLALTMVAFVIVIFLLNVLLEKPLIDSLLFSVALAVGLSPELLPAILVVTLSRGAERMAESGVIVRRLSAMESLGGMTILCSDKTGTLTTGKMVLLGAVDGEGRPSPDVLKWAYLNSTFQSGLRNPMDEAILEAAESQGLRIDSDRWSKRDEVPYDFIRRRMTIVAEDPSGSRVILVSKGAVREMLDACSSTPEGSQVDHARVLELVDGWAREGERVLALATRAGERKPSYDRTDERELVLEGFLRFRDPPHPDAASAIRRLAAAGVRFKLITGDHRGVALAIARAVGAPSQRLLTGADLDRMSTEALRHRAERTDIFAEVDPEQKERIILALKRRGHAVGYLGDGINDAPALHVADVGISVESAVDVARQAADIILVRHHLGVLSEGIQEGRATFANTLKYLHTATSANFGNMISMAVASVFLPFLPLTAPQVLLNNFLSDLPAFAIGSDRVDPAAVARPIRWNTAGLRRFMLGFGALSSVFDVLTFVVLLLIFRVDEAGFRTGWIVESLLTQIGIIFVVRTVGPFWRSRPAWWMTFISAGAAIATVLLALLPQAAVLGFVRLRWDILGSVVAISVLYLATAERLKCRFLPQDSRISRKSL